MRHYLQQVMRKRIKSLNPCCNGIYSMSIHVVSANTDGIVLILVVMEYTQ